MKIRLIAAGVLLCAALASCAEEKPVSTTVPPAPETTAPAVSTVPSEPETTAPTTESTQPATEPAAEPFLHPDAMQKPANRKVLPMPEEKTPETLLAPYWEETISWDDGYRENTFQAQIPQIYPLSGDAIALEAEIYDLLAPRVEEIRENQRTETSQVYLSVGYDAWVNEDVLSILVWQETCFDYIQYDAFNLDLTTGMRLDSAALAGKLGVEPDAYREWIAGAIEQAFRRRYEGALEDEFFTDQLESSVSPENLDQSMLYLGKDGSPVLVFDLYALAGANFYPTVLPLQLP